jgi:hypothetical protein
VARSRPRLAGDAGTVPLREHLAELRAADAAVAAERDRRYAEVKAAEEKALQVKEKADRDALALARQAQTYRDEQANKLREQINSERGLYATKDDLANAVREMTAAIKPLDEYVASTAGRTGGAAEYRSERRLDTGQLLQLLTVIVAVAAVMIAVIKR